MQQQHQHPFANHQRLLHTSAYLSITTAGPVEEAAAAAVCAPFAPPAAPPAAPEKSVVFLSPCTPASASVFVLLHQLLRQYVYFCASKASKLSTWTTASSCPGCWGMLPSLTYSFASLRHVRSLGIMPESSACFFFKALVRLY